MAPLPPFPWIDVFVILALVALNGVFAMSELALVSSRKARLAAMARARRPGARAALTLSGDPGKFLSTVQIGITLIGILAGAYSGSSLGAPTAARLELLGLPAATARSVGFALVIGLTTYASLIVGELVPKQIALRRPEAVACGVAIPMRWIARFTAPLPKRSRCQKGSFAATGSSQSTRAPPAEASVLAAAWLSASMRPLRFSPLRSTASKR